MPLSLRSITKILIATLLLSFSTQSFKSDQKRYSRVRQAYADKEAKMLDDLDDASIEVDELQIYLRAFKEEKLVELWAKNIDDEKYQLVREFKICRSSGKIGPKRMQGDLQVPEGFYHINIFNPYSNFYLSLGINYPNKSDRILGVKGNLGGDIFIHGNCVTIGCLPIRDENIKELYIYCVEAKNNGQDKIPVNIFPSKLTDANFQELKEKYGGNEEFIGLWTDLKKGFDFFEESRELPSIVFLNSGRHVVK